MTNTLRKGDIARVIDEQHAWAGRQVLIVKTVRRVVVNGKKDKRFLVRDLTSESDAMEFYESALQAERDLTPTERAFYTEVAAEQEAKQEAARIAWERQKAEQAEAEAQREVEKAEAWEAAEPSISRDHQYDEDGAYGHRTIECQIVGKDWSTGNTWGARQPAGWYDRVHRVSVDKNRDGAVTVNWSAIGSVPAAEAEAYARLIQFAAKLARSIEDKVNDVAGA